MMEKGYDIPGSIGLAGFNDVELLQGLPRKLATMDSCRSEIGRQAAEIILERVESPDTPPRGKVELTPRINFGDTLRMS